MAAEALRVLIAVQRFPPHEGIGARRWAKMAKYLTRAGAEVSVLSANLPPGSSPWMVDVHGIAQHHYHHHYPAALEGNPRSFPQKIAYRLALASTRLQKPGNPYDRAIFDRESFQEALAKCIRDFGPDVLVVSGAPFMLLHHAAALKPNFSDLPFIADFRDPWNAGQHYGYHLLKGARRAFEHKAEEEVLQNFDLVCTPWPSLLQYWEQVHPAFSHKYFHLPHGYDPDDVGQPKALAANPAQPPTLVYGGTIYKEMLPLLPILQQLAHEGRAHFHFYSDDEEDFLRPFTGKGFALHAPLPGPQFFEAAKRSDLWLFPIPDKARDGMPTKVFEYAAAGMPILATGAPGELSAYIGSKGLGHYAPPDLLLSNWEEMVLLALEARIAPHLLSPYSCTAVCSDFVQRITTRRSKA